MIKLLIVVALFDLTNAALKIACWIFGEERFKECLAEKQETARLLREIVKIEKERRTDTQE